MLHIRNKDTFDKLVVGNILQRDMEHGTSNGARISCIISQHSFSIFEVKDDLMSNIKKKNGDKGFFLPELDV